MAAVPRLTLRRPLTGFGPPPVLHLTALRRPASKPCRYLVDVCYTEDTAEALATEVAFFSFSNTDHTS